jgi:hypothetical protein
MHAVVNADDELAAVKHSIEVCEREIVECKEELAAMAKRDPDRAVRWQALAALRKELAARCEKEVLLLQQAQGGCVRRQHVPATHRTRPSAPLCACCAARMRHGALVLEYRTGHVQQLHSEVQRFSFCLTCLA